MCRNSKGGSGVVLYASKYDDVPRVVNASGRFDMKRGAAALGMTAVTGKAVLVGYKFVGNLAGQ